LDLLGLKWPLDSVELRARYKDLAKQHHPDATGGDKQAEERLKDINRAYSLLRHRLAKQPVPAG
jgi:curved DNA-binding protein CbpA